MKDLYNLIYNGTMDGSTGWNTNRVSISTSYGIGEMTANTSGVWSVLATYYIPVFIGDSYKFSCDVKRVSGSSTYYIGLCCFDKYKNEIANYDVGGIKETTLTQDLNDGDTVVHLASVAGWYTTQNYRRIGICDSRAFGSKKNVYSQKYDSGTVNTTDNTVTLQAPWAGGKWLSGTSVACFTAGNVYVYPVVGSSADLGWVKYNDSLALRHGTAFVRVVACTVNGSPIFVRNMRLWNATRNQIREPMFDDIVSSVKRNGTIACCDLREACLPVRYIKDYANGNTVNTANHFCEIQAFDVNGTNVAFASNGSCSGSYFISGGVVNNLSNTYSKPFHAITNGNTEATPYIQCAQGGYIVLDLGQVYDVTTIKTWHYWGDGRTYHNTKVEVSVDGTNWVTVFDSAVEGEYAETSAGKTIELKRSMLSMRKDGVYEAHKIIEY